MALNPIVFTEKVVRSFLRYQLTAYPFADERLHEQMRRLLSLDETRQSPLLKGPYVSLSRPFRQGAAVRSLCAKGVFHPHMRQRIPAEITHVYGHQEDAIRAIRARQDDAGLHRHRLGQDRVLPLPDRQPVPGAAGRRAPAGHLRRDRLSDERAGRRPARPPALASGRHGHLRSACTWARRRSARARSPASVSRRALRARTTRRGSRGPPREAQRDASIRPKKSAPAR